MWRALLGIATGKVKVYNAMVDFFRKVPWDDIAMISDADRAYFADGRVLLGRKFTALIEPPRRLVAR